MASNRFSMQFYTYRDISDVAYAKKILEYCGEAEICWEKIDYKEPLRKEYEESLFYKYWCTEKLAGFKNVSPRKYASVFCSCGRGSVALAANWSKGLLPKYSIVSISVNYKVLLGRYEQFNILFQKLVELLECDYACFANENFWFKCHRDYARRLALYKDIHWKTFFSKQRLQEMSGDINTLFWHESRDFAHGVLLSMCDYIPKDNDRIEDECMKYRSVLWNV